MFKKSKAFYEEHKQYILPVIHFEEPILTHGKNEFVYDLDGNEILDLNAGQFCTILGHSNDKLPALMQQIATSLQHSNTQTLSANTIKTMQKIHNLIPEMNAKSIFLATGSESVEFALRYAKHITGKTGLVCFDVGYHGLTLGSQSITYKGQFAKPLIENIFSIECEKVESTKENLQIELNKLEEIFKNHSIAAFVCEPVVSVGGMFVQSEFYLSEIKKLCQKYSILLIFDECQTCMMRCSEWFGFQAVNVVPDILIAAKGLGLGFPVGLVCVDNRFVENLPPLTHYSSHQNDNFSSMIVDFLINYIKENNLKNKVQKTSQYFFEKLNALNNPCLSKARGLGLMLAVDLQKEGVEDFRVISANLRSQILKEHKILLQATNGGKTLRFLPNYEISHKQIDRVCEVLKGIRL